jgi:hypothetical protein
MKNTPDPTYAKAVAVALCDAIRACDQDAALGKLFRPAVAQNPSMSTPVVGQFIFLGRETRCAWQLSRGLVDEPPAAQAMATLRFVSPSPAPSGFTLFLVLS